MFKIILLNLKIQKFNVIKMIGQFVVSITLISLLFLSNFLTKNILEDILDGNKYLFEFSFIEQIDDGLNKSNNSFNEFAESIDLSSISVCEYQYIAYTLYGRSGVTISLGEKKYGTSAFITSGYNFYDQIPHHLLETYEKMYGKKEIIKEGRLPENENEILVNKSSLGNGDYLGLNIKVASNYSIELLNGEPVYDAEGSLVWYLKETILLDKTIVGYLDDDFLSVIDNPMYIEFVSDGEKSDAYTQKTVISYQAMFPENIKSLKELYDLSIDNPLIFTSEELVSLMKIIILLENMLSRVLLIVIVLIIPIFLVGILISIDKSFNKRKEFFGIIKALGYTKNKLVAIQFVEYIVYFLLAFIISIIIIPLIILLNDIFVLALDNLYYVIVSVLFGALITFVTFFLVIILASLYHFKKDSLNLLKDM